MTFGDRAVGMRGSHLGVGTPRHSFSGPETGVLGTQGGESPSSC